MESRVKDLCLQLYEIGALKFGDFKMKVGVSSPVYFDLRMMISYPTVMNSLSNLLWDFAKSEGVECDVVCGVPYTALPLATLIAVKADLPMLIRRKEAKEYGTKKLIEGVYSKDDLCVIFEDVVTTGSSILETVNDLKHEGLVVKEVVAVLDREQGGAGNLARQGITMKPLMNLTQILRHLKAAGKVDDNTINRIHTYIQQNQLDPRGEPIKEAEVSRLELLLSARAEMSQHAVAARLLRLMHTKQSLLCVAADVTASQQLLTLAAAVGPHIALLKTHADIVTDWSSDVASQLASLARQHEFLIMEDRKFADIGHTAGLQYSLVRPWADLVTVHGLPGDGLLQGIQAEISKHPASPRGVVLIAQLSCSGNLITPQYTKSVMRQAATFPQLVAGIVCQSADVVVSPGLLQLTPGVSVAETADSLGQQYNSPQAVVCERGADLAIVGRAVVSAEDPARAARELKAVLWQAYQQRVKSRAVPED
uniref:Uridine 5'-monophosphate synthase n=1 Tax=Graphocephala atropunctata TaxID=36148 RepID=A0A1B6KY40_9HEMI